jgi:hypothetical protein
MMSDKLQFVVADERERLLDKRQTEVCRTDDLTLDNRGEVRKTLCQQSRKN